LVIFTPQKDGNNLKDTYVHYFNSNANSNSSSEETTYYVESHRYQRNQYPLIKLFIWLTVFYVAYDLWGRDYVEIPYVSDLPRVSNILDSTSDIVPDMGLNLSWFSNDPRGLRNNNPGNLTKDGSDWIGLDHIQTDSRFYQFSDARYGIRAMSYQLNKYRSKYGLTTISGIINRWAPPSENKTQHYIQTMVNDTGIAADKTLENEDMKALIKAMIKMEVGYQPYSNSEIEQGVRWAGMNAAQINREL
jgi:hypothetical protein